jgi:hypothetical protein
VAVTYISLSAMRDDYLASEQVPAMDVVVCGSGNQRVVIGNGIVQVLRKLYVVLIECLE